MGVAKQRPNAGCNLSAKAIVLPVFQPQNTYLHKSCLCYDQGSTNMICTARAAVHSAEGWVAQPLPWPLPLIYNTESYLFNLAAYLTVMY